MRREDFYNDITMYEDLISLANETEYFDLIYDIHDDDSYSNLISERIDDVVMEWTWEEVRDFLDELPHGYDYYLDCGYCEYIGLADGDDVFSDKREELYEYMCENDLFDHEEEDDSDEFFFGRVESLSEEEKLFIESVNDKTEEDVFVLFTDCSKYYQTI